MKTCTILGPAAPPKGASSAVLVQVMDIDETLFAKAIQPHTFEAIVTDGFKDPASAIAAAYPDWTIFASSDDLRAQVTQLLITAGLRQVDQISGKVELTPLAVSIDEWGPIAAQMGEPDADQPVRP